MKILVLGIANPHILAAAQKLNCTVEEYDPLQLYLLISESVSGYDRIYDGNPKHDQPKRLKVKDYDFILPRISGDLYAKSVILEHLNGNLGVYSPQKAEGLRTACNKIHTTLKLSQAGIKVPKTVWAKAPVHIDFIVNQMVGGLPIVVKTVEGSQGAGVSLLDSKLSANTGLESFYKCKMDVKIQRFVDGSSKDIRAIVVGDRVVTAMERTANKGDFRANLSKQGSGKKITLSDEDQELCVKASKAVGLEYSGVDLMKDQEGKSYCIEVNGNPGTGIIDITGINYFEALINFCKEKRKGGSTQKDEPQAQVPEETIVMCETDYQMYQILNRQRKA